MAKKRLLSSATFCAILVAAMLCGGTGTASAAPPGFSGPFTGTCKGDKVGERPLGIGNAKLEVWQDFSGSGTVCAKTSDNMSGSHWTGVTIGRSDWETTFTDHGYYSAYAGIIYVSTANPEYVQVQVTGWVEVGDTVYSRTYRMTPL
jgi:hypothetical protein